MSAVAKPMALDSTLQDVVDALPSPSQGAAGKTAYASAVSGGYTLPEGQFNADIEGLKWRSNPNLLDNWYFVGGGDQQGGPINQRKQTSYSSAGAAIDRWKLTSGSMTIAASGVTLNGSLVQIREQSIGQTFVTSALLSDGTMITPTYDDSTKTFTLTASNKTIVAVKLELGEIQTLAHLENGVWVLNEIPDYETQLLRCQRFYRVFTANSAASTGYGYSTNAKDLRPEMRVNPTAETFTVGGVTYYALNANL